MTTKLVRSADRSYTVFLIRVAIPTPQIEHSHELLEPINQNFVVAEYED